MEVIDAAPGRVVLAETAVGPPVELGGARVRERLSDPGGDGADGAAPDQPHDVAERFDEVGLVAGLQTNGDAVVMALDHLGRAPDLEQPRELVVRTRSNTFFFDV